MWRWTFETGGNHAANASSLVATFLKHGKPYIDKHATWDALSRELVAKPESLLDSERARNRDVHARSYRAFAHRFEMMIAR
ncbi:hypothetical protein [Lentzea jiangxiensis]|uniref:Uncharacterized protein n=1 Tax=Lentzea jiangxiensis TaxID=641025 RepID=A0A1H0T2J2_9PSEU|nr:hypothetical protein [Lentzea jiangxiensis]SDP47768.1 hypothetical protein SAMN05421507_10965 [Lentzea jiangxiensis]